MVIVTIVATGLALNGHYNKYHWLGIDVGK
jgi:hypothetical protein